MIRLILVPGRNDSTTKVEIDQEVLERNSYGEFLDNQTQGLVLINAIADALKKVKDTKGIRLFLCNEDTSSVTTAKVDSKIFQKDSCGEFLNDETQGHVLINEIAEALERIK